ncbi:2-amino-4-hydroxy-6-hydroxymethyldihydropteridine diphosphokinase [uncultured Arcticibacterium sp.]|uniref:2-amino-4-hydroxy-6- hydroxymethyldihydropteridine diphosphokinase n=1 Tax=uncultured Arcticibacterium sp. TaxID=2173042 RepID=UPI0030F7ABE7
MYQVFLGIGSNLGDRETSISNAIDNIGRSLGKVIKVAPTISTKAWGKTDSPDYLNTVVQIETELLPLELIEKVLALEAKLGRTRTEKWASRVIDIDILYFNNWYFNTPNLVVPHPYISERVFVLEPLANIAPDFVHPIHCKTNLELLNTLTSGN